MPVKNQLCQPFHSCNRGKDNEVWTYMRDNQKRCDPTLLSEEKQLDEIRLEAEMKSINKLVDSIDTSENINNSCCMIHDSKKILDSVADLYFFDSRTHKIMSFISSRYLFSLFSLEYLKHLNKMINTKYDLTSFHFDDLYSEDKIIEKLNENNKLKSESPVEWITNTCLDELNDIITNYKINDINQVNKLENIINLMFSELNCGRELKNIELYDILYKFKRRLDNYELNNKEFPLFAKYKQKTTKNGECKEYSFEIRLKDDYMELPDEVRVIDLEDKKVVLRKQ
mgnify:CR=1 FL=1|jgi:hypothetical protein